MNTSRARVAITAVALFLAACGAPEERPPVAAIPVETPAPGTPDEPAVAAPAPVPATPGDLVGAYHEADGGPDALNLVIDADGTWRWHIHGCDFRGNACGTWVRAAGDRLELRAAPGEELRSIDPVGLVTALGPLAATMQGDVVVVSGRIDGGEVRQLEQRWQRGTVCAVCKDGGPIALRACDQAPPKSMCH